ncbi:DUF2017 family protein [Microbacterium sp.]|uniref:DUF2017 family protein n=1 Tax=Microbacterium sp. TaxID=51671 RepID=UPI0025F1F972|nr:DUF2017 family protein [Microbacterium sp.]
MTADLVRVQIAPAEELQLHRLVQDFRDLIGADRDLADPALARLTPSPYPNDVEAAREFRTATEADLLGRRDADAATVSAALASIEDDLAGMSDDDAFAEREVAIPVEDIDAWLRTLTAIRLVIATRLGIDSEEDHDPVDVRFGVYDWLGYRLELLIEAAEELGV